MLTPPSGALAARIGTLSVEKNEKIEADAAKAEQKAAKKAAAEAKLKGSTKVGWSCAGC
jgi:hypothetical protein